MKKTWNLFCKGGYKGTFLTDLLSFMQHSISLGEVG